MGEGVVGKGRVKGEGFDRKVYRQMNRLHRNNPTQLMVP